MVWRTRREWGRRQALSRRRFVRRFTTFSTFGIDTFDLLRAGAHAAALVNIATQVVASLAAVVAGFNLGRMI